ncbi:MAG: prepilin-type N-terminal cleavage/methylation domain-containing protein [Verrucomicrobia bacterium]|nr:prepilin-type N-terminal cleavage/methylation domain-containing protein [Verrucomicrobiota bacterium]MBI3871043.1 prepilin-type N-terminal cleavage/methylation domain-containing protein [Verrucomicrobiota bacterium]
MNHGPEIRIGVAERAHPRASAGRRRAFTLVELMVVVGIAMLLLTVAVPAFVQRLSPESMRRAVSDLAEACSNARAFAILKGAPTVLRIRIPERAFEVAMMGPPVGDIGAEAGLAPERTVTSDGVMETSVGAASGGPGMFSGALHSSIRITALSINGEDWTEDPVAEIRFFPNGTCDGMSLVIQSAKGEQRNVWLEVVTGLASVETDVTKFFER